jgi:hypothetical protein
VQIEQGLVGMHTTEETKDFPGAVVFWQVSEKHGGRCIQEKTQSSISNLKRVPYLKIKFNVGFMYCIIS